jgi:hypothetical protein
MFVLSRPTHPLRCARASSSPTAFWPVANSSLMFSTLVAQTSPRMSCPRSSPPFTRLTRAVSSPLGSGPSSVEEGALALPWSTMMRLRRRSSSPGIGWSEYVVFIPHHSNHDWILCSCFAVRPCHQGRQGLSQASQGAQEPREEGTPHPYHLVHFYTMLTSTSLTSSAVPKKIKGAEPVKKK